MTRTASRFAPVAGLLAAAAVVALGAPRADGATKTAKPTRAERRVADQTDRARWAAVEAKLQEVSHDPAVLARLGGRTLTLADSGTMDNPDFYLEQSNTHVSGPPRAFAYAMGIRGAVRVPVPWRTQQKTIQLGPEGLEQTTTQTHATTIGPRQEWISNRSERVSLRLLRNWFTTERPRRQDYPTLTAPQIDDALRALAP